MAVLPVIIDARGAVAGAAVYNKSQASMAISTKATNAVMKRFLTVVAGFAIFRSITKTIAEFELTMRKVQGVTSQTDKQMQAMIKTARELGATTQFSATQAGEGLLFLSRAGFTAEESISALPSTLNLAAAGALELGAAADLVSNVLRQFGLEATETERVVDALVRVSNQANTDVTQLGEAMKFAGPIAAALGKTVEETAVMIGLLGDAGIQASMAGTNLRGVLLGLAAPTEGARATIEKLGLSMEQLNPETNSMVSIFTAFRNAAIKSGQASQIFGKRNVSAALILSDAASSIEDNVEAIKSMNSASTIAELIMNTLSGSIKELGSATNELFLSIGDAGLLGTLKNIIDVFTGIVRALAESKTAIAALAFVVKVLAIRFIALKAIAIATTILNYTKAIGVGTIATNAITGATVRLTIAQRALNVAMALNPIGLIVTVAAIAVASVISLSDSVKDLNAELEKLADNAPKKFGALDPADFIGRARVAKQVSDRLEIIRDSIKGVTVESFKLQSQLRRVTGQEFQQVGGEFLQGQGGFSPRVSSNQAIKDINEQIEKFKLLEKVNKARQESLERERAFEAKQEPARQKFAQSLKTIEAETAALNERLLVFGKTEKEIADLIVTRAIENAMVESGIDLKKSAADRNLEERVQVIKMEEAIKKLIGTNETLNRRKSDAIDLEKQRKAAAQEVQKELEREAELIRQNQELQNQSLGMAADGLADIIVEGGKAIDVIRDLAKEFAKMAIRRGFLSIFSSTGLSEFGGGGVGDQGPVPAATGALFAGGHKTNKFGVGGLVTRPTTFPVGMNLLGEGTDPGEFVLPAARGADGKLGVRLAGIGGGGGGSSSTNNNQRLNITNNFFGKTDRDSFRRSTKQQLNDARKALDG